MIGGRDLLGGVDTGASCTVDGVCRLRKARSGGSIDNCHASLSADIVWGGEGGSLGGVVDSQVVFVPLFAITLEPALGDGSYKTSAGCEM